MENIFDWSVILSLVGVLVVITNIIVQVLKSSPGQAAHKHPCHACGNRFDPWSVLCLLPD